jgi:ribosome biogenesis GTPase
VLFSSNNLAMALCEDGRERLCSLKGKRIKTLGDSYNSLAAGDEVEVEEAGPGRGMITSLRPRRNSFGRYNEKGRAEQAIAANIDRVVCVTSPRLPPFRPRFIDRLAVLSERAGSPFVILMNKVDLGLDPRVEERLENYEKLGYQVLRSSVAKKEGLSAFAALLQVGTTVLAGQSGVGKSSILNAILPGLDRKTGEVSEKYNRGKHTTTLATMIVTPAGYSIIDTPGIRRLALRSIPPDELVFCFPEMARLVSDCALGARCSHVDEEGCAVREALERSQIHPDRYESYIRIREELDMPAEWKKDGPRDPSRRIRSIDGIRGRKIRHNGSTELDEDDFHY